MKVDILKSNIEEVKSYLSRNAGGSLILDTNDTRVEWTTDNNAINHSTFVVIDQCGVGSYCECEESFNEECEQCQDQLNELLGRIDTILIK